MTPCPTQKNKHSYTAFTVDKTRRSKIKTPSLNDDRRLAELTLHTAGVNGESLIPRTKFD